MINSRLFKTERVCRLQLLIPCKFAESSPKGKKALWKKEKLLVTSNFSYSHNVFRRLVLQTRKNKSFFWKGLFTSNFSFSRNAFHSYISLMHQNVVLRCNRLSSLCEQCRSRSDCTEHLMIKSLGCIMKLDMDLPLTFFAGYTGTGPTDRQNLAICLT